MPIMIDWHLGWRLKQRFGGTGTESIAFRYRKQERNTDNATKWYNRAVVGVFSPREYNVREND